MQKNIPLKNYSNYGIGGRALFFLEVSNPKELEKENLEKFDKIFILGGGTNVLIDDRGFDGLVIHDRLDSIVEKENLLHVGSGVLLPDVIQYCINHELSNLEWAGGLPGTVGGAVRGNAGAFGREIKDIVLEVESMDLFTKKIHKKSNRECKFGYRSSIFKTERNSELITSVTLQLQKGDKDQIRKLTEEKIEYRKNRHPLEYPNIGSTFKNIALSSLSENLQKEFKDYVKNDPFPVVTTTKLLALAGLKGRRVGDAQISDKHPNFIVNLGNAKSSDVLQLVELAKRAVKDKWGIDLEEEIFYLN